jgi:RIO kinase 1
VVDVVGDPQGPEFLARDVRRITEWSTARGPPGSGTVETLLGDLRSEAGIGL